MDNEEKLITPKEAMLENGFFRGRPLRVINSLLGECPVVENEKGMYIEFTLPWKLTLRQELELSVLAHDASWDHIETQCNPNNETMVWFYLGK